MNNSVLKILLFVFTLLFYSCEEDELTELKYDGTGGMSCLVDGKVINSSAKETLCEFKVLRNGSLTLQLGFFDDDINDYSIEFIELRANDIDADKLEGAIFLLADKNKEESYGVYQFSSIIYKTNSTYTGELNVLYYDRAKRIIGGTFWFDGVNNGERAKIRDGRFDIPVKNPQ
jgi:hypothetical protein